MNENRINQQNKVVYIQLKFNNETLCYQTYNFAQNNFIKLNK